MWWSSLLHRWPVMARSHLTRFLNAKHSYTVMTGIRLALMGFSMRCSTSSKNTPKLPMRGSEVRVSKLLQKWKMTEQIVTPQNCAINRCQGACWSLTIDVNRRHWKVLNASWVNMRLQFWSHTNTSHFDNVNSTVPCPFYLVLGIWGAFNTSQTSAFNASVHSELQSVRFFHPLCYFQISLLFRHWMHALCIASGKKKAKGQVIRY